MDGVKREGGKLPSSAVGVRVSSRHKVSLFLAAFLVLAIDAMS